MVLHETGERGCSYSEWVAKLPNDQCRYFVFDYCYEKEKRKVNRIVMIVWCPLNAPNMQKITYAYSKDGVKSKFKGIHKIIEADSQQKVFYLFISKNLFLLLDQRRRAFQVFEQIKAFNLIC